MKKQAKNRGKGLPVKARKEFEKGKRARQARAAKVREAVREPIKAERPPAQKAIALPPPSEVKALDTQTMSLTSVAKALYIASPEQEKKAVQFGSNAKALEKKIAEFWKKILSPIGDLYDEIKDQRDAALLPVTEAMTLVKDKLKEYYDGVDKAKREEADRLNKEREKRALAEAKPEAMKLIREGKIDEANDLLRKAKGTISEVISAPAVASAGGQRRETRDIEVFDEDQVPDQYWVLDMIALRDDVLGRNGKKAIEVPGVRITGKKGVAFRAAQEA